MFLLDSHSFDSHLFDLNLFDSNLFDCHRLSYDMILIFLLLGLVFT